MRSEKLFIEPFTTLSVSKCNLMQTVNEHFTAEIEGIISKDDEEKVMTCDNKTQININIVDEEGQLVSVFRGLIQFLNLSYEYGVIRLTISASSYTCTLEKDEKIRSFQDCEQTYKDIVSFIANDNEYVSVIYTEGKKEKAGDFIVQYGETDWDFIKRMASKLHTVVVADCNTNHTCFFFGLPVKKEMEMKHDSYAMKYSKSGLEYVTESREIIPVCTPVLFKELHLYVYRIESFIKGNELIHQYTLRPRLGFHVKEIKNEKIIGASIFGYVKKIRREQLQIDLTTLDNKSSTNNKWFFMPLYIRPQMGRDGIACRRRETRSGYVFPMMMNSMHTQQMRVIVMMNVD